MDKPTYPQANFTALDDERDPLSPHVTDPRVERAAAHWEAPSSKRKFIPAIVIGVAVAGLAVGMDYKFSHDKKEPATPTLAQGPAVEAMVNEAPPAAGSTATTTAPAAEQSVQVAPGTSTPPGTTPAAAPPPPVPAPRAERTAPRAITPAPRPAVPEPEPMQRSAPSEAPALQAPPAVTPAPEPEVPSPAQEAIQPPAPMPTPQPAPEAPASEKPSGA